MAGSESLVVHFSGSVWHAFVDSKEGRGRLTGEATRGFPVGQDEDVCPAPTGFRKGIKISTFYGANVLKYFSQLVV